MFQAGVLVYLRRKVIVHNEREAAKLSGDIAHFDFVGPPFLELMEQVCTEYISADDMDPSHIDPSQFKDYISGAKHYLEGQRLRKDIELPSVEILGNSWYYKRHIQASNHSTAHSLYPTRFGHPAESYSATATASITEGDSTNTSSDASVKSVAPTSRTASAQPGSISNGRNRANSNAASFPRAGVSNSAHNDAIRTELPSGTPSDTLNANTIPAAVKRKERHGESDVEDSAQRQKKKTKNSGKSKPSPRSKRSGDHVDQVVQTKQDMAGDVRHVAPQSKTSPTSTSGVRWRSPQRTLDHPRKGSVEPDDKVGGCALSSKSVPYVFCVDTNAVH